MFGGLRQVGVVHPPQPSRQVRCAASEVELFQEALHAFHGATGSPRQAWLIEAVIRRSRAVAEVRAPLEQADREALLSIAARYQAYAGGVDLPPLSRYADAAALLKQLFF